MADTATTPTGSGHLPGNNGDTLGQPVDFDIRGLGRRLPKTEAPEGWVKKIERSREGKVWVCLRCLPATVRWRILVALNC